MKEGFENIDEVFKQAFDGFEGNVDPSVWTNVQNSISSNVGSPQADPVSSVAVNTVAKSIALKIAAGVIALGTVVGGVYYANSSDVETEDVLFKKQSIHQ